MKKTELQEAWVNVRGCFDPAENVYKAPVSLSIFMERLGALIEENDGVEANLRANILELCDNLDQFEARATCAEAGMAAFRAEAEVARRASELNDAERKEWKRRALAVDARPSEGPFEWVAQWLAKDIGRVEPERKAIMCAIRRGWLKNGRWGMVAALREGGFERLANCAVVALSGEKGC